MVNLLSPSKRVRKGISLLNKKIPGWFKYVVADRINVDSLTDCPVAQIGQRLGNKCAVGGGYTYTLNKLNVNSTLNEEVEYGFDLSYHHNSHKHTRQYSQDIDLPLLNKAWKKAVINLQNKDLWTEV